MDAVQMRALAGFVDTLTEFANDHDTIAITAVELLITDADQHYSIQWDMNSGFYLVPA